MLFLKFYDEETEKSVTITNDGVLFYLTFTNKKDTNRYCIGPVFANVLLTFGNKILSDGSITDGKIISFMNSLYKIYRRANDDNAPTLELMANIINAVDCDLFTSTDKRIIKSLMMERVKSYIFLSIARDHSIIQQNKDEYHFVNTIDHTGVFIILNNNERCEYINLRRKYDLPAKFLDVFIWPLFMNNDNANALCKVGDLLYEYLVKIYHLAIEYRKTKECIYNSDFIDALKSDGAISEFEDKFSTILNMVVN